MVLEADTQIHMLQDYYDMPTLAYCFQDLQRDLIE